MRRFQGLRPQDRDQRLKSLMARMQLATLRAAKLTPGPAPSA